MSKEQDNSQDEINRGELDRIAAEQDADLNAADAEFVPGEAPAVAGDLGNAQCVAMGLEMAVAMGKAYFPSLEATAPPEKCQQVAASVGAVLDKYGVQAGGWLSQYGPELAALVTCSTFGMGVYAGIKADIAAREAAEAARPKPQAAAVTVSEETPAKPDEAADLPGWRDIGKAA